MNGLVFKVKLFSNQRKITFCKKVDTNYAYVWTNTPLRRLRLSFYYHNKGMYFSFEVTPWLCKHDCYLLLVGKRIFSETFALHETPTVAEPIISKIIFQCHCRGFTSNAMSILLSFFVTVLIFAMVLTVMVNAKGT